VNDFLVFIWQCLRPGLFATSPASLLPAHFVLSASIPIAFPSAAATHIVQATHANAKTKACPKSVAAPVRCEWWRLSYWKPALKNFLWRFR